MVGLLSRDELERMERFCLPVLRRRFAVARGALRMIVARYVGGDPADVEFSYEQHGKPYVKDPRSNLQFNLSHSDDLMVIAVCMDQPIGVDIEREDHRFHLMDVAALCFCESEKEQVALEGKSSLQAFFQIWTAKEAIMKATSLGMSLEPSRVEVGLNPLRLLAINGAEELSDAKWHLIALSPREGYSGALAVAAEPSRIVYRDFQATLPGDC
ncbi:MAG TPA: 4'-phosphopantetheinyl transferase superfamily protein [Terrimicrobiaceae bacterium]